MNKLIIIGASGHGKVIADIAELGGYSDILFLDDNPNVKLCGKYEVIGSCNDADEYKDADFFVAIGDANIRRRIQTELINSGLNIVSLIHPNAVVAKSVSIGVGTAVMAGAVINPDAVIGQGCIINTCSSVDHDCIIGDFSHVSVGAHLAGTVVLEEEVMIGVGAVVINNVKIAGCSVIGAGAVVLNHIPESGIYIGAPAKQIRRGDVQ